MTTTADTNTQAEVVPGDVLASTDVVPAGAPTFKELTARFARLDAFEKALTEYVKRERATLFTEMESVSKELDTKSFNVRVDDEVVATMTITEPSDSVVVDDEEALIDWLLEAFPTEVETVTRPKDVFLKALREKYVDHDESGVFLKDLSIAPGLAGTEVPGLRHVPAKPASSFSTRWKSPAAKKNVLDGVMGEVAPILGITAGGDE